MTSLLAPYQNAMRIGQGFNSYTQQICVDNVVSARYRKVDPTNAWKSPNASAPPSITYSSRYVTKLSDVFDSMNISGSFAIKFGTTGGTAPGSFVDANKFKESDMNFLLQVKVTYQTQITDECYDYKPIDSIDSERFTDVFGDCFISGFQEGGEFNALISIKVFDHSKVEAIKRVVSASLNLWPLSGEADVALDMAKKELSQSTETTVSVSLSGGGVLDEIWTIESVLKFAAKFPVLVAETPQRTSAILTKYTHLRSFVESQKNISPLFYDNTGAYAADLLDAYMDYKLHLKNINLMLENCSQYMTNPVVTVLPEGIKEDENMDISPIEPNLYALTLARTCCRVQMAKIVQEVDAVAKDPSIASALEKAAPFQSPDVFGARLPVPEIVKAVNSEAWKAGAWKAATHSPAFAALRLVGLNKTHLYYRDTKGNIRLSVCSDLQNWTDGGIVADQQDVSINSPICATTQYNDGKTPYIFYFNKAGKIVERYHNGDTWADGSISHFTLPAEPAPFSQLACQSSSDFRGKKLIWLFYQGKDRKIYEMNKQGDAWTSGPFTKRGLQISPGSHFAAAESDIFRLWFTNEKCIGDEWYLGQDWQWHQGGYNPGVLILHPNSATSSITALQDGKFCITAFNVDNENRITESDLGFTQSSAYTPITPLPVKPARAGTKLSVIHWGQYSDHSYQARMYYHTADGRLQECIRKGRFKWVENRAIPLL